MSKTKLLKNFLVMILVLGILASSGLVLLEIQQNNICPTLLSIPACYIILFCFSTLLLIQFLGLQNYRFYSFACIPLSIALYGSVGQIIGGIECPKTDGGIPMCFISLLMFSSIIVCKFIIEKENNE